MNTWDGHKCEQNLKDHGIDFVDREGFFDGDLLTREDTRTIYSEQRFQSIGVFNLDSSVDRLLSSLSRYKN